MQRMDVLDKSTRLKRKFTNCAWTCVHTGTKTGVGRRYQKSCVRHALPVVWHSAAATARIGSNSGCAAFGATTSV